MDEHKGKAEILFDDEISAAESKSKDPILIVADLGGREDPRTKEELKRAFELLFEKIKNEKERSVLSVEEICEEGDVRIEGKYTGLDGNPVEVSIPVLSEATFSEDGLTRGASGLHRLYVEARTFEQAARYLAEHNRNCLTEEEIESLEKTALFLEESLDEEES